jgi:glycerophosphoryl diester phosphodiesterase
MRTCKVPWQKSRVVFILYRRVSRGRVELPLSNFVRMKVPFRCHFQNRVMYRSSIVLSVFYMCIAPCSIVVAMLPTEDRDDPSSASGPMIVAHRGASFDAPENTLSAFRLAWEQGADAIEGDFYLTKDQQVVCIHDGTTKRTAIGQPTLVVANSTLEQLRQLDVGKWKGRHYQDEKIPTLTEVLASVPASKKFFLEIKCGPEIIPFLKTPLEESGLSSAQVTIICFDEEVVRVARRELPQFKVNWLTSFKQDKVTKQWSPSKEEVIKRLRNSGATGIGLNGNGEIVDEKFVRSVLDLGLEFHVWTINDVNVARKFSKWGAYSITTDKPAFIRDGFAPQLESLRSTRRLPFTIENEVMLQGYDGKMCWVHARPGVIPAGLKSDEGSPSSSTTQPTVVITTQQLDITGSDVFHELHSATSLDLGKTWSRLAAQSGFERKQIGDGMDETVCDFSSSWHATTGKLLGVGHSVRYFNNSVVKNRPRHTAYSTFNPRENLWSPPQQLEMPKEAKFYSSGAGSVQRFDLPNGNILLPIYFKGESDTQYSVTVCECDFDGKTMRYRKHGDELTVPVDRGLSEPSLTSFGNRFFLTMRNDQHGYVTSGNDGLHFAPVQRWKFDDGEELGNYNTQQHWVSHSTGLFLVYTRKGARNDHVFRHRAPLFIAQVDPERLCILRATETIVVPERGARLGNFGVSQVSENEIWIVASEWMQSWKQRGTTIPVVNPWGADNSIHIAKLRWGK